MGGTKAAARPSGDAAGYSAGTAGHSAGPAGYSAGPAGVLAAVQGALAAEHAAVYGYGVVGARSGEAREAEATAAYDAHRARRDGLARTVRDLGGKPAASAAAYALPFPVEDPVSAVRLAAVLEDRVAAVYSDLVRAAEGPLRQEAAVALREAAVRAARWRGSGVAFPGLAERAGGTATAAAGQ